MATTGYREVRMDQDKRPYTDVYLSIGGWQSVFMTWDDECGCHTPWETGLNNTSLGRGDKHGAIVEAMCWADNEGVEYRGATEDEFGKPVKIKTREECEAEWEREKSLTIQP